MEKMIKRNMKEMIRKGATHVQIETEGKTYTEKVDRSWDRETEYPLFIRLIRKFIPKAYEIAMANLEKEISIPTIENKYKPFLQALYKNGTFEKNTEKEIIENFQDSGFTATVTKHATLFKPDFEENQYVLPIAIEEGLSNEEIKGIVRIRLLENLRNDLYSKELTVKIAKRLRLI